MRFGSAIAEDVYGFTLQETSLPLESAEEVGEVAQGMLEGLSADALPHLAELTAEYALVEGYSFEAEFMRGLELILDGLQRELAGSR